MIAGRPFFGFKRMPISRGLCGAILAGVLIGGSCWLSAADDSPGTGLRGVLPQTIPSDLTAAIESLPDNWKPWGAAVSADLATLYEKEGVDSAEQRKAIGALRRRMASINTYVGDPRYRSLLNPLVTLWGGLKRRLDTAEAALDTLERGPESRAAQIDSARRQVAREAQSLDAYLGSVRNGSSWVKYLHVSEVKGAAGGQSGENSAATLSSVQSLLKDKNSVSDARTRDFLAKPQFAAYERALDAYLAALAVPNTAANNPDLRKNLSDLLGALEQYETSHTSAVTAAARKAYDAVRATAPDGGERMGQALRSDYFNYNVRFVASEAYLGKFVGQSRDENGPVRDFILGADVYGSQTTHTDVGVDLVPCSNAAEFDVVARGAVASSTEGITDQATIFTSGNHYFTASKRVIFNGDRFSTQPARIAVNANNTTTGADTNIRIPLVKGFANRIAVGKAEQKRGESEAIAASRVQDKVLPQFNAEVDKQFGPSGAINRSMAKEISSLQELQLYPDAKLWSSTDTELKFAGRLMAPDELGGSEPNPALYLGRGLTVLVHESVINNAIDRMGFAGQTLTDDQVKAKIEDTLSRLLDRDVQLKDEKPATEEEAGPKTLVFDKADPIRVQVGDGSLVMTIRAGFKQEGKEDIPTQIVTLPLQFTVDMKNVVIEPGDVSIAAAEPPESAAKQLARAGVIRKKISTAFPRREQSRVYHLTRDNKRVQTAITRIRALDGWLSVSFE
ncbi:MAG TPA: hypothetical protein VKU82_09530 [Planctomycetaceae bacterium]|nr:hypothetical protein [Planctomycetaceae bacterium]